MKKKTYEILLIEKKGCSLLVYGQWFEDGHKCRGLVCKVYCLGGLFIRCHPFTGAPVSVHTSLEELKKNLKGHT